MEISQLCSILEACMSPNQQQRAAAEQTLSQASEDRLCDLLTKTCVDRGPQGGCTSWPIGADLCFLLVEDGLTNIELLQFQHARGQLVNLLRIAVEPTLTQGVRQVAAISFKNLVKQSWDPAGAQPVFVINRVH